MKLTLQVGAVKQKLRSKLAAKIVRHSNLGNEFVFGLQNFPSCQFTLNKKEAS